MKVSEMEARGRRRWWPANRGKSRAGWCGRVMKGFRIVLLTVLWSGLGMGAGLFCGIVGVVAWSAISTGRRIWHLAYRSISIPVAIVSGSCAFLWNLMRTLQARQKAQG